MKKAIYLTVALLALILPSSALAQGGAGSMPGFSGIWNPKVGSGAAYSMKSKHSKEMTIEMAVVEKEKNGAWIEMAMQGGGMPLVRNKMLFADNDVKKAYMQMGDGGPVMDMTQMIKMGQQAGGGSGAPKTDIAQKGKLIGTEEVTTAAGTFTCEHYRSTEDGMTSDAWVSKKVAPFGLVKFEASGKEKISMELQKVITNAKSKVTGTPQSFQLPPGMMEQMQKMQQMQR